MLDGGRTKKTLLWKAGAAATAIMSLRRAGVCRRGDEFVRNRGPHSTGHSGRVKGWPKSKSARRYFIGKAGRGSEAPFHTARVFDLRERPPLPMLPTV
eukprot:365590-Chlamydomonas_euryale.AAC.9